MRKRRKRRRRPFAEILAFPLDADEERLVAEYIEAKCQEIQAGWTATERRKRLVFSNPPAVVQVLVTADCGLD